MLDTIAQWQRDFVGDDVIVCAKAVGDYTDELSDSVNTDDYDNCLLRQADGSVAWPAGSVGSISHTNDWAVAAVCKPDQPHASVGIDVERIDRVDKDVLRLIATEQERVALEHTIDRRWGRVALFSIKESLYKCLRPIYGEFIKFKDVQVFDLSATPETKIEHKPPIEGLEIYSPSVKLLLPELAQCCDETRIQVRLAILPKHVLSFVTYQA